MGEIDFQAPPWWTVISGAGTSSAEAPSWADDYTRHRSGGIPTYSGTTYSGTTDMSYHGSGNSPTDVYIGRIKTGRELDKSKY